MLNNPQNEEGAQAFKDGKDISSNPYDEGHPHFQFFIDGFVAAANKAEEVVAEVVADVVEVATEVKDEVVKLLDDAEGEVKAVVTEVKETL